MAEYYGIDGIAEAREYMANKILNSRIREITTALLECEETDITAILGCPNNMKLCSSMTKFYHASGDDLYKSVVEKYYHGKMCDLTVELLG